MLSDLIKIESTPDLVDEHESIARALGAGAEGTAETLVRQQAH